MDYELKYKEALKWMQSLYSGLHGATKEEAERYFPELKENEDERIRKEIIDFIGLPHPQFVGKRDHEKWIAWLEKQNDIDKASYKIAEKEKYNFVSGQFIECRKSFNEFKEGNSYWFEYVGNDTYIGRSDNILNKKFHITPRQLYRLFTQQHCPKENNVNEETNPTDKVKPKFEVGDCVVNNNSGSVCQVTKIRDDEYCLCPLYSEIQGYLRIIDVDTDYHLWTINDAKDGDVLVETSCIFIIQKLGDNSTAAKTYCTLYNDGDFDDGSILYFDIDSTKPATKEQRDLLFQKIKDAGYEWDSEKKELKKIEPEFDTNNILPHLGNSRVQDIIDANKKVDRVIGTADHIKTALDVLNKKGGEK